MHKIYDKRENVRFSDHFRQHEFDCKCKYRDCTFTIVDTRLVYILEELRARTGEPVIITSGYRCQMHNGDVGGVNNSFHKRGQAVDISLPTGWSMNDYVEQARRSGFMLIIPYEEHDFVHCQISAPVETEKFLAEIT